jgi:hypothetical protein
MFLRNVAEILPVLYGVPTYRSQYLESKDVITDVGFKTPYILRHYATSRKVAGSIPNEVIFQST